MDLKPRRHAHSTSFHSPPSTFTLNLILSFTLRLTFNLILISPLSNRVLKSLSYWSTIKSPFIKSHSSNSAPIHLFIHPHLILAVRGPCTKL